MKTSWMPQGETVVFKAGIWNVDCVYQTHITQYFRFYLIVYN